MSGLLDNVDKDSEEYKEATKDLIRNLQRNDWRIAEGGADGRFTVTKISPKDYRSSKSDDDPAKT